ncbi:MAG TPA: hypothetical protein VK204_00395 [Nocardioidaceae bacterium]|nr:hypothetical protein [Nocardioidaceae bacterium]
MTGTIDDAVWPANGDGPLEDESPLDVQRELDQMGAATALLEQAKGVLIFRYAIDACSAHKLVERWATQAGVGIETVAHALVHEICQGDKPDDPRFVRWLEDQLRHEFPDGEDRRAEEPAPVTVAVDQSDSSLDAVVEAARHAARLGLPLAITIAAGALNKVPEAQRAHLAKRIDLAVELVRAVTQTVKIRRPAAQPAT